MPTEAEQFEPSAFDCEDYYNSKFFELTVLPDAWKVTNPTIVPVFYKFSEWEYVEDPMELTGQEPFKFFGFNRKPVGPNSLEQIGLPSFTQGQDYYSCFDSYPLELIDKYNLKGWCIANALFLEEDYWTYRHDTLKGRHIFTRRSDDT